MLNNRGWVLLVPSHRTLVKTRRKVSYHTSSLSPVVTPCYRLVPAMRKRERAFAALAILGSFIGGVGLICLSVFDTIRYTSLHRIFLLVFIVGVSISAIFSVCEVRSVASTTVHNQTLMQHSLVTRHSIDGCLKIMMMSRNSDPHILRRRSLPLPSSCSQSPLPSGCTQT